MLFIISWFEKFFILIVIKVFGSIYDKEENDIYFNIISLNKKVFNFFGLLVSFILI